MRKTIYYYDFWVGTPEQKPDEWKLDGLKMPSPTPIVAMFLRSVMYGFDAKKVKTFTLNKESLISQVHKVAEYEMIKEIGQPLRYRKIRDYYISESLFKSFK